MVLTEITRDELRTAPVGLYRVQGTTHPGDRVFNATTGDLASAAPVCRIARVTAPLRETPRGVDVHTRPDGQWVIEGWSAFTEGM